MNETKFETIDDLCQELVSQLLSRYKTYYGCQTSPIFDVYFKEKFGVDFERKVVLEAQIFKRINQSIKVAEMLERYQNVLDKLEKKQPVNSMKRLLSYVDNKDTYFLIDDTYEELRKQQELIEYELNKFGISSNWLESHGLYKNKKSKTKALQQDTSPQRNDESVEKYLERILRGVQRYEQILQIYVNGTPANDRLLYRRVETLRRYLISNGIVPKDFKLNILYDEIEKVNK